MEDRNKQAQICCIKKFAENLGMYEKFKTEDNRKTPKITMTQKT